MGVCTIAVVDDDVDDREFITMALNGSFGKINVQTYPSGTAFLDNLAKGIPDMVITDLRMPLMTGFELISQIRAGAETKHLPIVVISTSANEADKERAAALGASAYYVKPYLFDQYSEITEDIRKRFTEGQ